VTTLPLPYIKVRAEQCVQDAQCIETDNFFTPLTFCVAFQSMVLQMKQNAGPKK